MTIESAPSPTPPSRYRAALTWIRRKEASFFIYMAARIASASAGFFTVKFLIEYLAKSQYGLWGVFNAADNMAVPVLTLVLPSAMMRMFFDYATDDVAGQRRLISTTFGLSLVSGLVLVAGSWMLGALGVLEGPMTHFLMVATSASILIKYFNYLTRLRDDYGLYFFNSVFDRVGFMTALAFAPTLEAMLPGGLVTGRLETAVFMFASIRWTIIAVNVGYYAVKRVITTTHGWLSRDKIQEMVIFAGPLTVIFFLGWTLNASDIFVLKELSTLEEVADYTFAVGIAAFVTLITQSVLTDWPRFYYATMRDNPADRDERIAKRVRMFLWMHVGGIVIIRVIARLAYDLYGADQYLNGLEYLNYLVLANFFFLAGNLFSAGIGYVKKNQLSLVTFGLPGVANVLLNLWLIPMWGARAAALTTLGCYAAFSVMCWFVARPHYPFVHARWYALAALGAVVVGLFPASYGV